MNPHVADNLLNTLVNNLVKLGRMQASREAIAGGWAVKMEEELSRRISDLETDCNGWMEELREMWRPGR